VLEVNAGGTVTPKINVLVFVDPSESVMVILYIEFAIVDIALPLTNPLLLLNSTYSGRFGVIEYVYGANPPFGSTGVKGVIFK
jgi:hypothetical protein